MSVLREFIEQDFEFEDRGLRYIKTVEHSSLVLDTEKDLFFWNSKGIAGNALTWLTKVKGLNFAEAKSQILTKPDSRLGNLKSYTYKGEEVVVLPELVEAFRENGKHERTYWYDRGLTDKTIDRFKLGYYNGWYLIPIFVSGEFINFQTRRDLPDKRIEVWYRGTGSLLFNSGLLTVVNSVIISESPTDAILLQQHGLPAISHTGGARRWKSKWFGEFSKQEVIYILYDNDETGREGAKKVAKNLGTQRCRIYTFDDFPDKYDVGDFFSKGGKEKELTELIRNNSKYAFEL